MQQSTAVPRQNRFMKKSECCIAEQFLDRKTPGQERMLQSRSFPGQKDSWKRQDAAEQSGSLIEQISGKDGMLHSRAVPGQNRFMEKTGCCRAEHFLDRIDLWKRRDAAEQSGSWIEQIYGKDGMLHSIAVPGQDRFLEKTGCYRAEQFLDRIDFRKRRDSAEQSSSWIEQIPGKDRMLHSRAVPGQNRFPKKTGLLQSRKGRGAM